MIDHIAPRPLRCAGGRARVLLLELHLGTLAALGACVGWQGQAGDDERQDYRGQFYWRLDGLRCYCLPQANFQKLSARDAGGMGIQLAAGLLIVYITVPPPIFSE